MSTPRKSFGGVVDARTIPPLEFELAGQTFRATPKPPLKVIEALMAVAPNDQGKRTYAASVLLGALEEMVIDRIWTTSTDTDAVIDDGPLLTGRWVEVDDRARIREMLYGDEYVVPIETIAEVVMWIVEETTTDPTGAPRR